MSTVRTIIPIRAGPVGDGNTVVRVSGHGYLVDLGGGTQPRTHGVHKDRSCSCGQASCPAIKVVAEGLRERRLERAPDPPAGFSAVLPVSCPVCGAPVSADHRLDSRTRGLGWRCSDGGSRHYWLHKWEALRDWFFREEILPGLRRGQLATSGPMGYLPECNR